MDYKSRNSNLNKCTFPLTDNHLEIQSRFNKLWPKTNGDDTTKQTYGEAKFGYTVQPNVFFWAIETKLIVVLGLVRAVFV